MIDKRIGYIRVSTLDQNPDRQLPNAELDRKFIDYASAKSTDRPQLQAMLDFVREGDTVVVHSMDRLARNVFDLRKIVTCLNSKKVQVHFLKENLIFNGNDSAMSSLMLTLMGAFAQFELDFIRERQAEGIEIAKKKGKFAGRKHKLNDEKIELLKKEMTTRKPKSQIAEELGISRQSLYRYLSDIGISDEKTA
jgi:DNA invertase Pin-like site-specific DNA recombinase